MKRIVLAYTIAVVLVLGSTAWSNPEIRVNIGSIKFGHIGVDYNLYQTIEVHNTGSSDLVITNVSPSCDCSRTWLTDSVVAPGQFTTVRLKYNTKNWYGDTEQHISIESNDPKMPSVQIPYHSYVGQYIRGIIPKPKALFLLPGKSQGQIQIVNTRFDRLDLELIDQADPFFKIAIVENRAGKGEKLLINVIADESLTKGTHESSFRIKVKRDDREEPVIISIPVKIVKY